MIRCFSLMRRVGSGGLALGACLFTSGCDDTRTCTLVECSGSLSEIVLVDEAGGPAAARGEYRSSNAGGSQAPLPFDCFPADAGRASGCPDGRFAPSVSLIRPDERVEVRFRLNDGTWSEWQALALNITSHTDPDFNGPGCSCTWYSATAAPLVVPADARLPAP